MHFERESTVGNLDVAARVADGQSKGRRGCMKFPPFGVTMWAEEQSGCPFRGSYFMDWVVRKASLQLAMPRIRCASCGFIFRISASVWPPPDYTLRDPRIRANAPAAAASVKRYLIAVAVMVSSLACCRRQPAPAAVGVTINPHLPSAPTEGTEPWQAHRPRGDSTLDGGTSAGLGPGDDKACILSVR